jgi:hypothetical protein
MHKRLSAFTPSLSDRERKQAGGRLFFSGVAQPPRPPGGLRGMATLHYPAMIPILKPSEIPLLAYAGRLALCLTGTAASHAG